MSDIPIDFETVTRFLNALAGFEGASFCFQTFDDSPAKRRGLAWTASGTFETHRARLAALNAEGAGIFVTVNSTDGRGRLIENVVSLRAVFVDSDGTPLPPAWHLVPNVIVRRGDPAEHRWHAYWFLRDGEALENFEGAQKALRMHYGTDHTVFDLPRVMRIPGFVHRKAAPARVAIEDPISPMRNSIREILLPLATADELQDTDTVARVMERGRGAYTAHLAAIAEERRVKKLAQAPIGAPKPTAPNSEEDEARGVAADAPGVPVPKKSGAASPAYFSGTREARPELLEKRIRAFLAKCDPAIAGQGGSNRALAVASALVNGFCLSVDEAVRYMESEWNPRCSPPWAPDAKDGLRHKCESAARKGKGPGGQAPGWLLNDPGNFVPRHGPASVAPTVRPMSAEELERLDESISGVVEDPCSGTDEFSTRTSFENTSIDCEGSGLGTDDQAENQGIGGVDQVEPIADSRVSTEEVKRTESEISSEWIQEQFPKRFSAVCGLMGLDRDRAAEALFIELARYLPSVGVPTAERVKNQICKDLPLARSAYNAALRMARAQLDSADGDEGDWMRFARRFLAELGPFRSILRWREEWYEWSAGRGAYSRVSKEGMQRHAARWLSSKGVSPGGENVANFLISLKALRFLDERIDPPCWIDSKDPSQAYQHTDERRPLTPRDATSLPGIYVSLTNGIFDIAGVEFKANDEIVLPPMIPHTPDWWCLNALPYTCDAKAWGTCSQFYDALNQWQPRDESDPEGLRQRLLQDWAGYLFMPGQPQETFMLWIGKDGGDGKSQLMKIMRALMGEENCASKSLDSFDPKNRFGLASMIGKTLATIPDASQVERLAVGVLKAITGGDKVGVDRKNKEDLDVAFDAKIIISSNEMPGFNDQSEGIWRRLLMLYWNPVPHSAVIKGFAEKLIREEMPGIFMWAVEGFHRLRLTGEFKRTGVLQENVQQAKSDVQHERKFFDECVEIVPENDSGIIWQPALSHEYGEFCKRHGLKQWCHSATLAVALRKWLKEKLPLPVSAGGRGFDAEQVRQFLLEANFVGRETKRLKQRLRFYKGVRLLEEDKGDNAK